ncbi:MAG TPA: hypothetical protein VH092_27580 [Urbifossiella sp.]|nr:hypothetical protein [Urbifossiella sp.]
MPATLVVERRRRVAFLHRPVVVNDRTLPRTQTPLARRRRPLDRNDPKFCCHQHSPLGAAGLVAAPGFSGAAADL